VWRASALGEPYSAWPAVRPRGAPQHRGFTVKVSRGSGSDWLGVDHPGSPGARHPQKEQSMPSTRALSLALVAGGLSSAACTVATADQEPVGQVESAVVGVDSLLYFRSNATGWGVDETTRSAMPMSRTLAARRASCSGAPRASRIVLRKRLMNHCRDGFSPGKGNESRWPEIPQARVAVGHLGRPCPEVRDTFGDPFGASCGPCGRAACSTRTRRR
jgi:hypothetical protein